MTAIERIEGFQRDGWEVLAGHGEHVCLKHKKLDFIVTLPVDESLPEELKFMVVLGPHRGTDMDRDHYKDDIARRTKNKTEMLLTAGITACIISIAVFAGARKVLLVWEALLVAIVVAAAYVAVTCFCAAAFRRTLKNRRRRRAAIALKQILSSF